MHCEVVPLLLVLLQQHGVLEAQAMLLPHMQTPPVQVSDVPAGQVLAHSPQLFLSEPVSTHVPAQHLLDAPMHTMPQAPQLFGSLRVFTHAPSQFVSPEFGHAHMPSWQVVPVGHAVSQSPQWAGSDLSCTQASPQTVPPSAQPHAPLLHVVGALQAMPQSPQFWSSLLVSTHLSPQMWSPSLPSGHLHVPLWHVVGIMHACPQLPQLALSLVASTQLDWHCVRDASLHLHMPAEQVELDGQTWSHMPQWLLLVCRSTHWMSSQHVLLQLMLPHITVGPPPMPDAPELPPVPVPPLPMLPPVPSGPFPPLPGSVRVVRPPPSVSSAPFAQPAASATSAATANTALLDTDINTPPVPTPAPTIPRMVLQINAM